MSAKSLFFALTALGSGILTTSPAFAEPLDQAIRHLADSHPVIQSGRNAVAASEQQIESAFGAYLPRVDVYGDLGPEYVDTPYRQDSGLTGSRMVRQTVGIKATQLLYDGGKTSAAYETARLQADAVRAELNSTEQSLIFEGLVAYLDVVRQKDLLALSRQNEANIMQQMNLEDERVRRGSGITVDVLQAKARLQLAKERRVSIEGAYGTAMARYQQLFGVVPNVGSMSLPELPRNALPASLEEAASLAAINNPGISAAGFRIGMADQQREVARSDYMPKLNLEAAANIEKDNDAMIGTRRDMSIVVRANWNIFNGFSTRAETARAAFEHAAAKDRSLDTTRQVEEQARSAWHSFQTAAERVDLLENAVQIASEVHQARLRLREMGKETAINVLDAENEVYNARINLTTARFDRRAYAYQLMLATGRLDVKTVLANL